ncbi:uncharacterized GPI-anchored protein At5g19250 [Quercus lobata]|uniref:Uncharacterized GPI-anchored protein At5g19230-like domain-containing protein n=1 Tax=Quercus lobata TaxID=97700 RepID=A0A7N2R0N5_QUELO|nr:uncharacterized GPI-anchored protein At5g19250 [Quercus lobata]
MASLINLSLFLFVLFHAIVLLSHPVYCDEDEDNLLQGINSYRNSLNRPALIKNEKADCLADEIANELEDEPCTSPTNGATIKPSSTTQLPDLPKHFKKCKIDVNTTVDGIILPVCVPKLVPTLVLTNYTRTANAKYINSSKYTVAGFGGEDDWMVTVLGTNTTGGSFSSAISLVSEVGLGHCLMSLLLGLFFIVVS